MILIKLADRLHNMRTMDHKEGKTTQISSGNGLCLCTPRPSYGLVYIKTEMEDLAMKWEPDTYRYIAQKLQDTKGTYPLYQRLHQAIKEQLEKQDSTTYTRRGQKAYTPSGTK